MSAVQSPIWARAYHAGVALMKLKPGEALRPFDFGPVAEQNIAKMWIVAGVLTVVATILGIIGIRVKTTRP
jgi:hypothetical protein